MPVPDPTEISIDEHGEETHESWLLGRASRVTSNPGAKLFDSEIRHAHYITLSFSRATRKRELNHDWLHATEEIIEVAMSEAQWGALVSSFGNGSGVPVTLARFNGALVPGVSTHDSRLDKSHQEVKGAAVRATQKVREAQAAVDEAFERGAGKKEMREKLRALKIVTDNLPSNMEFAAKSLTEHTEAVVVRARADIEAMVFHAVKNNTMIEGPILPEIASGHAES